MTLDPVHFDGIVDLARRISPGVDATDHRAFADTVWREFLDPLQHDGTTVIEPVGDRRRSSVDVQTIALAADPFPTRHGLDSGTINPTTFKNGLVLDVAHAAMAADPSDLDLHRARSLVTTVHANDPTLALGTDWVRRDEGYFRRKILHAPRVNRYAEGVVHALALYLAESSHALEHADAVSDCLLLDGPLYPKELLNWQDRDAELGALTTEAKPRAIVANYVRLVERLLDRDVAVAGFVKNPSAKLITRTLREKGVDAPWVDDTAFFTRLLEPRADGETDGHRLTFTNWFRSRGGSDRPLAADGDALGVDRKRDPADYEVTFFVVYDPREDLCYRIEAPAGLTRDSTARDHLTRQILRDVAISRGPPPVVERADTLARIGVDEKAALRRKFEERLDSPFVRTYDDMRWGEEYYRND